MPIKDRAGYMRRYRQTAKGAEASRRAANRYERKLAGCEPITEEECSDLLKRQGGVCGICKRPLTYPAKTTCVDHSHETGKVRGILCTSCNFRLGWYERFVLQIRAYLTWPR